MIIIIIYIIINKTKYEVVNGKLNPCSVRYLEGHLIVCNLVIYGVGL